MTELTRLVIQYQKDGSGYEEIVRKASIVIYSYPGRIRTLTEDDKGDFLLYFVPKLQQIILNYQPERAAFEPYLRMCMKYRIMSYLVSRHRTCAYDPAETHIGSWEVRDMPAAADVLIATTLSSDGTPLIHPRVERTLRRLNRKSVLCFCLKAICDADDTTILRMARLCEADPNWLLHCKYLLLDGMGPRRRRRARMGARIGSLYARMYKLEKRFYAEADPEIRESLEHTLDHVRWHYERNCARARRLALRPTNRDIAILLHVAKGTVDNAVYTVRLALSKALVEEYWRP
jgi:DNA-directed RNA polymerase specialized sigma24 family protein